MMMIKIYKKMSNLQYLHCGYHAKIHKKITQLINLLIIFFTIIINIYPPTFFVLITSSIMKI
jgi:hypothetical protein